MPATSGAPLREATRRTTAWTQGQAANKTLDSCSTKGIPSVHAVSRWPTGALRRCPPHSKIQSNSTSECATGPGPTYRSAMHSCVGRNAATVVEKDQGNLCCEAVLGTRLQLNRLAKINGQPSDSNCILIACRPRQSVNQLWRTVTPNQINDWLSAQTVTACCGREAEGRSHVRTEACPRLSFRLASWRCSPCAALRWEPSPMSLSSIKPSSHQRRPRSRRPQ